VTAMPYSVLEPLPPAENHILYPALDGLRALAVLMVFVYHYLPGSLNWGWIGVDFFFVLSGFLITGILFDSADQPHRFRIFYIRRTLRIFPVYYLVLLAPVLLWPVFHWAWHRADWMWPVYLGNYVRFFWPADYLQNHSIYEALQSLRMPWLRLSYDHLWSLAVEEQFYLVWPLVVFTFRGRVLLRNLCLAGVVAAPLLRWAALHVFSSRLIDVGLLYRATPLRADTLLLGGALALAMRGSERQRILALGWPLITGALAIFAVFQTTVYLRTGQPASAALFQQRSVLGFSVIALLGAGVVLLAVAEDNMLYRLCLRHWLRVLGQRSYGFYVYHLLLFTVWQRLAIAFMWGHRRYTMEGTAVVALVGTLLLTWASFHWLEAPILRLKARFAV
jgi:peptidoglycan/LPS O-acetylase OafA/YrhL